MKKQLLLHVYNETAGTSGAYMEQTLNGLKNYEKDVEALVNYYYCFDNSNAIPFFYKFSQKLPNSKFRKVIRLAELCIDYKRVYDYVRKRKKEYDEVIVVLSLLACYRPILGLVKRLSSLDHVKLGLVIHDAIPFEEKGIRSLVMCKRNDVLKYADFFVTHNEKTIRIISKQFPEKIYLKYRFPLADLSPYLSTEHIEDGAQSDHVYTFLSLGVLRKEKGIPILLNAWSKVEKSSVKAKLIVAGKNTSGEIYDFSGFESVEHIDRYLDDSEYCRLIQTCDYGILPYIEGTNSAVLSSMATMSKPCITSDIEMFKDIPYTNSNLMFESGNYEELGDLIIKLASKEQSEYLEYVNYLSNKTNMYREKFSEEMVREYSRLSNDD